ncbi:MAG: tetratricopeptide repeat protein [bacterium]|nr:tetratricopeptide repeat protein [bacterium]
MSLPLRLKTLMRALPLLAAMAAPAAAQRDWETYRSDLTALRPRESFQFRVAFEEIQVRSWRLVVDGGLDRCDLNVLRLRDESLIYFKTDESHHEVIIPWGRGEEIIVVVTNRDQQANFTVTLQGPPRNQVHAAYGFHVNRALEAFAAGRRLEAEASCRSALLEDPRDGVAKVLLAGFRRDGQYLDQAAALIEEALGDDLPGDMRALALDLRADLRRQRAPLPVPVRQGMEEAERELAAGRPEAALATCEALLEADLEYEAPARATLQTMKGRALAGLERNFEAIDAYTQALALWRDRGDAAVVYFHMGRLYAAMDNTAQAEGAFAMALQNGLPTGLALQAREALKELRGRQPAAVR